jgi:hypothetical protein
MKTISQREARRLRKRVQELENQERLRRSRWSSEYPGGTNITTLSLVNLPFERGRLSGAQLLQFPLVCKIEGNDLCIYAVTP